MFLFTNLKSLGPKFVAQCFSSAIFSNASDLMQCRSFIDTAIFNYHNRRNRDCNVQNESPIIVCRRHRIGNLPYSIIKSGRIKKLACATCGSRSSIPPCTTIRLRGGSYVLHAVCSYFSFSFSFSFSLSLSFFLS